MTEGDSGICMILLYESMPVRDADQRIASKAPRLCVSKAAVLYDIATSVASSAILSPSAMTATFTVSRGVLQLATLVAAIHRRTGFQSI